MLLAFWRLFGTKYVRWWLPKHMSKIFDTLFVFEKFCTVGFAPHLPGPQVKRTSWQKSNQDDWFRAQRLTTTSDQASGGDKSADHGDEEQRASERRRQDHSPCLQGRGRAAWGFGGRPRAPAHPAFRTVRENLTT